MIELNPFDFAPFWCEYKPIKRYRIGANFRLKQRVGVSPNNYTNASVWRELMISKEFNFFSKVFWAFCHIELKQTKYINMMVG